MWQVVEDGDECHVRLRWRPVNGELVLEDTLIQDVHGLSQLNRQLLKQRGAAGDPFGLREASKKVASMVSVISTLKQSSSEVEQDSIPPTGPLVEEPENQEEEERNDS
jgi:hypothetical protein